MAAIFVSSAYYLLNGEMLVGCTDRMFTVLSGVIFVRHA